MRRAMPIAVARSGNGGTGTPLLPRAGDRGTRLGPWNPHATAWLSGRIDLHWSARLAGYYRAALAHLYEGEFRDEQRHARTVSAATGLSDARQGLPTGPLLYVTYRGRCWRQTGP